MGQEVNTAREARVIRPELHVIHRSVRVVRSDRSGKGQIRIVVLRTLCGIRYADGRRLIRWIRGRWRVQAAGARHPTVWVAHVVDEIRRGVEQAGTVSGHPVHHIIRRVHVVQHARPVQNKLPRRVTVVHFVRGAGERRTGRVHLPVLCTALSARVVRRLVVALCVV